MRVKFITEEAVPKYYIDGFKDGVESILDISFEEYLDLKNSYKEDYRDLEITVEL